MKNYPTIVKNKVDKSLKRLKHICPLCGEKNNNKIKESGHSQTLVGSFRFINNKSVRIRKLSKFDSNHHWFSLKCTSCSNEFVKNVASGEIWYEKDSVVLLGAPNCFENYKLDCSYCDGHGTVKRKYYELDGSTPLNSSCLFFDGQGNPEQIEAYACENCNREDKIPLPPHKDPTEHPKELRLNWIIKEEQGPVFINDYASGKIDLKSLS